MGKKEKNKIRVSGLKEVALENVRRSRKSYTQNLNKKPQQNASLFYIDASVVEKDDVRHAYPNTVRRERQQPMGRYQHWQIVHLNEHCELLHRVRFLEKDHTTVLHSPFRDRVLNENVLVLDIIGRQQKTGRLYVTQGKTAGQTLHDDACIAEVFDLHYNKETHSYRMKIVPYNHTKNTDSHTTVLTQKREDSKDAHTRPLFGSWMHLFMENGSTIHGKVVYSSDKVIELMVTDTTNKKEWCVLSRGESKSKFDRPTMHTHTLNRTIDADGSDVWSYTSNVAESESVDKMNYTVESSPEHAKSVMRAYLARVAPHGISYLKWLWSSSETTTTSTQGCDHIEHVRLQQQTQGVTMEHFASSSLMSHSSLQKGRCEWVFPFSVVDQLKRLNAAHPTQSIAIGLQLTVDLYQSFLYEHVDLDVHTTDTNNRHQGDDNEKVLLPTTQELLYAQSLSETDLTPHRVSITLRTPRQAPDAEHLMNCVRYCIIAQRTPPQSRRRGEPLFRSTIRFVDTTEEAFFNVASTSVKLDVLEQDAHTLVTLLTGQVLVEYDQSTFLSIPALDTTNTVVAQHLGKMSQHFTYHSVHYSPLWWAHNTCDTITHFRPMVTAKTHRARLPLPLVHNVQHNKHKHVLMPLHRDVYYPQTHNDTVLLQSFQSIDRGLPFLEKKRKVSQSIVAKKLSGSRALYDIDQLHDPQWFNVQHEKEYNDALKALNTHFVESTSSPMQFVIQPNVHTVLCDNHLYSHSIQYHKTPGTDPHRVEEWTTHESGKTGDEDLVLSKDTEAKMNTYGKSVNAHSRLSQLSHILYGSLCAFPNAGTKPYQSKPTKTYRYIDGHDCNRLVMSGVIALARWSSHGVSVRPRDIALTLNIKGQTYRVSAQVQPVVCSATQTASTNVFVNASTFCQMLETALIRDTHTPFQVHYNPRRRTCSIHNTEQSFVISDNGRLGPYGVPSNLASRWDALRNVNVAECTLIPKLHMHGASDVRPSYTPTRNVLLDVVMDNTLTDTTHGDADVSLRFTLHFDTRSNVPPHPAHEHTFQIVHGRDGLTPHVSLPRNVCAIRVFARESGALLVVFPYGCCEIRDGRVLTAHTLHTLEQYNDHITHCVWEEQRGVLQLYTQSQKFYMYTLSSKTLDELSLSVWKIRPHTNVMCRAFAKHEESQSTLEAVVSRDESDGHIQVAVYQQTGQTHRPCVPVKAHPSYEHITCCDLWCDTNNICVCVLDTENVVHRYTWSRDTNTLTTFVWKDHPLYETFRVYGRTPSVHAQWSSLTVNKSVLYVGDALGNVLHFERYVSRMMYTNSYICATHSHKQYNWYWRRLNNQRESSVNVILHTNEPLENIRTQDCFRSNLASSLRAALSLWFHNALLETENIAYLFRSVPMQNSVPLSIYLQQQLVGMHSNTPSTELKAYLEQQQWQSDIVYNAQQTCEQYVGGVEALSSFAASDVRTFSKYIVETNNTIDSRIQAAHDSAHIVEDSSTHTQKSTTSHSNTPVLSVHARRTMFSFKMSKLLQNPRGIEYIKQQYAELPVFRHQFHKCKGFCYYKLLYKCKRLNILGGRFPTKIWSDKIRDTYTTLYNGDVNYICNRCGESVCRQDAGLRIEFGAYGMSSTHQENANDENHNDTNEKKKNTFQQSLSFSQRVCLDGVHTMLEEHHLSPYIDILMGLPITHAMQVFLKSFKMTTSENNMHSFILQGSYNEKVVYKVVRCALMALRKKMDQLLRVQHKVIIPHKKNEEHVIQSFIPHIQLTKESVSRGIVPRADFRPKLSTAASPTSTPEWKRVYRSINTRSVSSHNLFDWTTYQTTSELYERNDIYLCVNKNIVDISSYTKLSEMIIPQLQFYTTLRDSSDRVRLAKAHATLERPLYAGKTYPLIIQGTSHTHRSLHERTATTRNVSDQKRRSIIYKHVRPSVLNSRFPFVLHLVLQQNLVDQNDSVKQLQCLLGIIQKQKARVSTNPQLFAYLEWVQYYSQLDYTQMNEKIQHLLQSMCFTIDPVFVKHTMRETATKFVCV